MNLFSRILRIRGLPDLSVNYADQSIAAQQRELVDQQIAAMRAGNAPDHFKVVGKILSQLRDQTDLPSLSLLDAACGSACYSEIAEFFVPRWVKYVGVDFNPSMLAMARHYYPALNLVRMDLRNLALQDVSSDFVMSGAAIVHIKEWESVIEELARVTRRWLLLHRTLVYTRNRTAIKVERHYDTKVYRVRINENDLLARASKLGMKLVIN